MYKLKAMKNEIKMVYLISMSLPLFLIDEFSIHHFIYSVKKTISILSVQSRR